MTLQAAQIGRMKELLEQIAKALVDNPDAVDVRQVDGGRVTVFELRTHPDDVGKVIGRQGRTVKAIRTLLGAMGMKLHRRFILEIVEERSSLGQQRVARENNAVK
ncbi:MAG TPA: KH domain-containing protein [Candidatus Eremiobacteraceae bacterium]|nr:KH domain-containing protein [Candidatus Eremiobacteraceae bacterium]